MTDITASPSDWVEPPTALSVADLAARAELARAGLVQLQEFVQELADWCESLPRHHFPVPDPTMVLHLMQQPCEEYPDPMAVEKDALVFFASLEEVRVTARRARATLKEHSKVFTFPVPAS